MNSQELNEWVFVPQDLGACNPTSAEEVDGFELIWSHFDELAPGENSTKSSSPQREATVSVEEKPPKPKSSELAGLPPGCQCWYYLMQQERKSFQRSLQAKEALDSVRRLTRSEGQSMRHPPHNLHLHDPGQSWNKWTTNSQQGSAPEQQIPATRDSYPCPPRRHDEENTMQIQAHAAMNRSSISYRRKLVFDDSRTWLAKGGAL